MSADATALASQALILKALVLFAVIACTTRFITGRSYRAGPSSHGDTSRVATCPYWIPYLGHLLPLMVNPARFLQKCRCVCMG